MSITVKVAVGADLLAACGGSEHGRLRLIWRRFSGPDASAPGPSVALAEGEVALAIESGAPEAVVESLPKELGGPCRFGLGYLVAFDARDPDAVKAWAVHDRVLDMLDPFPVDGFRAFMAGDPRAASFPESDKEQWLQQLAALPAGISLAHVERPTRSLVGFTLADEGAVVRLDADAAWPPQTF